LGLKAVFIPFEENLIEELTKELFAEMRENDLSHLAVVFPGKRPYYYLLSALSKKCRKTIFPPMIFSMDEFVSRLLSWSGIEAFPLNELDAVYILFTILKKKRFHLELPSPYKESFNKFEDFLFWGFEILRVIEEMDEALVDEKKVTGLKKSLSTGSEFSPPFPPEKIAEVALNLFPLFHQEMEEKGMWTRGYRYRKASSLPVSRILKEKNIEKIFFAGFFLFTSSEREIIQKAGEGIDAYLLFHLSERKKWEEFDKMFEKLKIDNVVELPSRETDSLEKKLSFHPASSLHFELLHLSRILKDEKEWDDLAIVLPKSETLIPLLSDVISRFDVEFNVSMGYPITRSPLFSLLESLLTLQETKEDDLYYLHSYLSIIKHPYVKNIRKEDGNVMGALFRRIERKLINEGLIFFSLQEVEETFDSGDREALISFHELFVKKFEKVTTFEDLSIAFENILEFLVKKSDFTSHPLSSEILEGVTKFLKDMKNSLVREEKFEIEALKRLFKGCATNYRIPLPGVPLKGVQIIGMLETRCLNFKKVVVLDLNEGILPGIRKHEPVFPISIRQLLGLPIYRDNEQIYRYHFLRLIRSAQNVMLFYIKNPEMPRSRFVEELMWEIEKKKRTPVEEKGTTIPVQIFIPRQEDQEKKGIKKDENTLKLLETIKFTPTNIDTYIQCPLKFYFKDVLRLSPPESVEEEVEPFQVGRVTHLALKTLFEPFLHKKLSQGDFDRMIKEVEKHVKEALKKELKVITPEREILGRIVTEVLKYYLQKEKEKREEIKILELENEVKITLPVDGKNVEMVGRWDRVEKVDNKIRIVDYKSGTAQKHEAKKIEEEFFVKFSRKKLKERGIESLQLPCYILIYREKYRPSLPVYAEVISLQNIFQDEKKWRLKWEEEIPEEILKNLITGIIREIFNAEINFHPDENKNCPKCPYRTPCLSLKFTQAQ